jgi:hypothetical protein
MHHLVQTTYNDVDIETLDTQAIFSLGAFVRYDSETQVTVCCTADVEAKVRAIILNTED